MGTHSERRIRVLLAKSDLDAHDRGLRYIAEVLRDAGMEIVYIRYGLCDEVESVAIQEDVEVIGLSFFGSGYRHDVPKVLSMLKEKGKVVKLIVGGTIPAEDWPQLHEMGVSAIFTPGTNVDEIIRHIVAD